MCDMGTMSDSKGETSCQKEIITPVAGEGAIAIKKHFFIRNDFKFFPLLFQHK